MIAAMCFLRCILVFVVAFSTATHQANVYAESLRAPKIDECRLVCGIKRDLPLTEINGGLYYISGNDNKKNWHEANNFCKENNMELLTIETEAENEAIKQKMNALVTDVSDDQFSIGLNDLAIEGEYRWASTGKVATFTNWLWSQPDDYQGNEDCGQIVNYKKLGEILWNDFKCSDSRRFICEITSKNLLHIRQAN